MAEFLTPKIVQHLMTELFKAVCDGAGRAIQCKEDCKTLQASLKGVEPLFEDAWKYSNNGEVACTSWLTTFKTLLEDAEEVTNQCLQESKGQKLRRFLAFWNWNKLPDRVKNIDQRIKEHMANINLVILGIVLAKNGPTVCELLDFEPQQIPPYVVGHEEHFNKLKASILESRVKSVHSYLGVHGKGGAGKTVLAKRLHNDEDIKAAYGEHSIVWITVGCEAEISQLYERMAFLLNDDGYKDKYGNQCLESQRNHLCNVFAKNEVLLILDDVWKKQYDRQDVMYWLDIATAPKSTTLITTRDSSILTKVHAKVEGLVELLEDESWELFCSYAFNNGNRPSNISEQLAKDVCKECGGLPLALTVIGSAMLEKKDERGWRCSLDSLKQSKSIPDSEADGELFGRLLLSYNELQDDKTKICFLYFAAFPEDYEIPIGELIKIWIAEGLFGTLDVIDAKDKAMEHLEILVRRSLIRWTSEEHNYVQVHDILRDVAMYIIEKAKPGECAFECYFQVGKEIKSFPSEQSLQHVKRMSFMESIIYEWPEKFNLPHLRVCLFSQTSLDRQPLEIPLHLFSSMYSLQYLDLAQNLFEIGEEILDFKGLMNLAYLDLSRCSNLKNLPINIGELKCLTHLDLQKCKSLMELPLSIGELKCLTHLNLRGCESLMELPVSIGKLTCLTHLDLGGCVLLKELPVSIGELKCLTHLDLQRCKSLKELPMSISQLTCLTHLDLGWCDSLREFPASIGELDCLLHLQFKGCKVFEELPVNIGKLTCLTHLDLGGCLKLEELPVSIGKLTCLTHLDLKGCECLEELPVSIGKLMCLTHLDLGGCLKLEELPVSIGKLTCLTHLDLGGCLVLEELPVSIGELQCLIHLNLQRCESLKELPVSISKLTCLIHLNLSGCDSLKKLPMSIGELKCLTHLNLQRCKSLNMLPMSIGELKCLTHLDLQWCVSLEELPISINKLKCLTHLELGGCDSLMEFPMSIVELKCLTHLNLGWCVSLKELPVSIGKLKCLTHLDLGGCVSLKELPVSIGKLKCLTHLDLGGCVLLKELPVSIVELKCLTRLNVGWCTFLKELPVSIGELKCLTHLDLEGCVSLKELPVSIGKLKCLTHLDLRGCVLLKELPASINEL
jgi:Leucine-rich repeat (LRR) protein